VSFRFPWIARTVGLDNLFENTLNLNVSVNGASVADPASFWGDPYPVETIFTPLPGMRSTGCIRRESRSNPATR